jgi:hypothetical protein
VAGAIRCNSGAIGCKWVQLAKMIRMMRFVKIPENLKKVQLDADGCDWVQMAKMIRMTRFVEIPENLKKVQKLC